MRVGPVRFVRRKELEIGDLCSDGNKDVSRLKQKERLKTKNFHKVVPSKISMPKTKHDNKLSKNSRIEKRWLCEMCIHGKF